MWTDLVGHSQSAVKIKKHKNMGTDMRQTHMPQERLWMGFTGDRTEEIGWQLRMLKDVFKFSRGVFLKGAGGASHVLLLELHANSRSSDKPNVRPRALHLYHCTCVSPDYVQVVAQPRSWQGPVPDSCAASRPWHHPQPPSFAQSSQANEAGQPSGEACGEASGASPPTAAPDLSAWNSWAPAP